MRNAAIALVFALVANATANVLIRMGMRDLELSLARPAETIKTILLNGPVMAGIVLFAANVLAYAFALSKIRVGIAYPIMTSCGLLIVLLLAWQLMGERITLIQLGGVALILGGVVMVSSQMG
ncbi:EamA family transporter [bacterium]|nr:EamA family transporter [bacterium]